MKIITYNVISKVSALKVKLFRLKLNSDPVRRILRRSYRP